MIYFVDKVGFVDVFEYFVKSFNFIYSNCNWYMNMILVVKLKRKKKMWRRRIYIDSVFSKIFRVGKIFGVVMKIRIIIS